MPLETTWKPIGIYITFCTKALFLDRFAKNEIKIVKIEGRIGAVNASLKLFHEEGTFDNLICLHSATLFFEYMVVIPGPGLSKQFRQMRFSAPNDARDWKLGLMQRRCLTGLKRNFKTAWWVVSPIRREWASLAIKRFRSSTRWNEPNPTT